MKKKKMKETLWKFTCPFCFEGEIIGYKRKYRRNKKEQIEFTYLGNCCDYYPKENPMLNRIMERLELSNLSRPSQVCVDRVEI